MIQVAFSSSINIFSNILSPCESYSKIKEALKKFFVETEQDSLVRHICRQAIFVALPISPAIPFYNHRRKMPIAGSVAVVAASILGMLSKRQKTLESIEKLTADDKIRIENIRYIRSFIWKTICYYTIQPLIHEAGHYFSVLALLKNQEPEIELILGGGGVTTFGSSFGDKSFYTTDRSWLGKKFSGETVEAIIAGAGPAFQTLHACAEFFAAFLMKKCHPEASDVFRNLALQNISKLSSYAFSVMGTVTNSNILATIEMVAIISPFFLFYVDINSRKKGLISDIILFARQALPKTQEKGDFFILRDYGFHPLLCFSIVTAIPAVFQLSIVAYEYFSSKSQNENIEKISPK